MMINQQINGYPIFRQSENWICLAQEEILHFSAQALCDLRWALTVQGWVEPTLEDAIATAPGWAERSDYVPGFDGWKRRKLGCIFSFLSSIEGWVPFFWIFS